MTRSSSTYLSFSPTHVIGVWHLLWRTHARMHACTHARTHADEEQQ